MDKVAQFKRECHSNYLSDLRKAIPSFPRRYVYPDGNPIRPVLPVQKSTQKIMIVGAFPSARFERREGKLIPVADNLSPFGPEEYFDGREVRIQESAAALRRGYLDPLGLDAEDLWITDIVKVYLYPKKHIVNCRALFPSKRFLDTHRLFPKLAQASRPWLIREIQACNPRLVITLGEVCARVIAVDQKSGSRKMLDGHLHEFIGDRRIKVIHLAHPEIRRRNTSWDERTRVQIDGLTDIMSSFR